MAEVKIKAKKIKDAKCVAVEIKPAPRAANTAAREGARFCNEVKRKRHEASNKERSRLGVRKKGLN